MKDSASHCVQVVLDTHECNGCGGCAELCPEVFRMAEGGDKAELINHRPEPSPALEEAARLCARQCINLENC